MEHCLRVKNLKQILITRLEIDMDDNRLLIIMLLVSLFCLALNTIERDKTDNDYQIIEIYR